jgi:hypothetical protein
MSQATPSSPTKPVNTPLMFVTGLAAMLSFALITKWMIGGSEARVSLDEKRAGERAEILQKLQAEDSPKLAEYGWVDKEKQLVRIPVERAMELTLAEIGKKPVRPAYPITGSLIPPVGGTASPSSSATGSASKAAVGTPKP